jgi:hypothetical protein
MKLKSLSLALALASFWAPFAIAQAPAAPTPRTIQPCAGTVTFVRVSEVKPGMLDTFNQAVAGQLAWYRTNGVTNNKIYAAPILVQDDATKEWKYSDTQIITFHVNPPPMSAKLPRNDDAWKAYVKLFNDSSTIKIAYTICSPAGAM